MKRTLLAAALLLTSVFGVTGCGSDDVPPAESRIKNSNYGELDYEDLIESDLNDDMVYKSEITELSEFMRMFDDSSKDIVQYVPDGVSEIFAPLILINGRRYGTDNIGDSRDDAAAASKSGADSTDVDDDYVEEDADSSDDEDDEEDEIEEP